MITMPKGEGCFSTANMKGSCLVLPRRGKLGRQEFWIEQDGDGYSMNFADFGNYGRERWFAVCEVEHDQIQLMINELQSLLAGGTNTTRQPFVAPSKEPEVSTESDPEGELEAVPVLGHSDVEVEMAIES